jgi:hypothetical protein
MTMQADIGTELLGLTGAFPRPGWVVLDALRERRFTGEVVVTTSIDVTVYVDTGRIYFAERHGDPSLGLRLVDAGTLAAAELADGAMRIAGAEYLGRLFERVPAVDRHAVVATTEIMTEECLGWLAGQRVHAIDVTPYRHHPAGVQRWFDTEPAGPSGPLPAPPPGAIPLLLPPPLPSATPQTPVFTTDTGPLEYPPPLPAPAAGIVEILPADLLDDMVRWNEPSFLDDRRSIDLAGRLAAIESAAEFRPDPAAAPGRVGGTEPLIRPLSIPFQSSSPTTEVPPAPPASPSALGSEPDVDWIDRLQTSGLPEPGSDPLASPTKLPDLGFDTVDRFELIWPSGEIDEQFGSQFKGEREHPDIDRSTRTARIVPNAGVRSLATAVTTTEERPAAEGGIADADIERWLADEAEQDAITDSVVLAVRRAVASIEIGALDARRRLTDVSEPEPGLPVPGRVALRDDAGERSPSVRVTRPVASSVFDEPVAATLAPIDQLVVASAESQPEERSSALRRLIGSLRRR